MLEVRTESGSLFQMLSPNEYTRTGQDGIARTHKCLIWGSAVPLIPGEWRSSNLCLVLPHATEEGIGAAPVKIIPFAVIPGCPLAFVRVEMINGVPQVVHRISSPVVSFELKDESPEGKVGPLPEEIRKLLEKDD